MNWQNILTECGVKRATAEKWAPAFSELCTPAKFSAGFDEIDDFLAQILHESGMLERIEENLNYSTAERIKQVFGSRRFPTVESALPFVRQPEKLANYAYKTTAGNKSDGDGWKYRGGGLIQTTGLDNYLFVGKAIGIDLVLYPEKIREPYYALKSAIAWWEGRIPDSILNDVVRISRRVNGGDNGLDHRRRLYETCRTVLAGAK